MTQAQVYGYLSSWKMAHPEYTNTQLVNKWNATFNFLPPDFTFSTEGAVWTLAGEIAAAYSGPPV